ncbi:hypothetical protein like AT4G35070 [Hibiscus trionum]|uniref:RING-type domain-containing protein n=1 Tax=Hibiscus trionum TaxID=183268 RepID=A0A9W7MIF2_HIBTR|nr:hypothetical protein like AT4G35070 [Hibiscus trionum]
MAIQAQFFPDNAYRGGAGGSNVDGGFNNQFRFSTLKPQQLQQPWNIQSLCSDHNNEIDQFIVSQNERLRLLLQQQSKQQIAILLKQMESKASILLNQREEEMEKARNKTRELQNLLEKVEMDNHAWKKRACESEAMAVSLNKKLEILREQAAVDDEESWCEIEDEESTRKTAMVCKRCESPNACVLLLPCRHLCSCKECEAFLDYCPVCTTEKKASIEALIS